MFLRILDRLEEILIASLIAGATLVIFVAVVQRYALGVPFLYPLLYHINLTWAQELCIYMFVWMAKFGAAYGVRTGIHVGVDVVVNMLEPKWRKKVVLFGLFCGALFTFVVGTMGAKFVIELYPTDQVSPDMELPRWIIFLCVPLGSYLMCFRFLQVAWAFFWTGELPHHDPGHVEGVDEGAAGARPMNSALIFGLLIALMLTGMPISIALGLTVLSFLFVMTQVPIEAVALKLFTGIESFEIMAIPFFILAGNFLTHGGVARRMIAFATSMVGHWYGGLGLAAVLACALFAAISGSSPATVVAIGSILLPAMVAQGYPKRFGAGVIATSGALGILIPPSIVMVLVAVATGGSVAFDPEGKRVLSASVAQLFMAGVIPGIILATMLGMTTFYRAWKNGYPRMPKASWLDAIRAFRDLFWGLALIVIVLGGIYTGAFTPTEAAAVSAVYAFVVAVFVYRDMGLRDVPKVLLSSANMSAMILYIITNAVLFSFLMTSEQIPQAMTAWIKDSGISWVEFLLVVNLLLLLAGNVMEPSSIVLITAPILFPIAVSLGINPVHLGILMTVNMEVGLCHPPVGLNLYVASGIARMGITELTIATWPWLVTMLIFLAMVTYIPELSLWLPRVLGML